MKNALQAQLLKAGLVDAKQAKKANKQTQHAKKTGADQQQQLKAELARAQQDKQLKDQELNQIRQQQLEEKTLKANILQMIEQYRIQDSKGDVGYQFIDAGKIKKLYLSQSAYNAVVNGSLCIAKIDVDHYPLIPKALAERIEQRMSGYVIGIQQQQVDHSTTEEDPYAAYVIPDDLMW